MPTVHIPGHLNLHQPQPSPGWRTLGEVERGGGDSEGVALPQGALALSPMGTLAQLGAGVVNVLDQGEARRALVCAIGPLLHDQDWQIPLARERAGVLAELAGSDEAPGASRRAGAP